ncbi:MAG TPA: metallophosphoesterase [Aggregatilineales bacterium]|nr:metallophosphoesterase [Aggregatilineales bacterium]
MAGISRRTFLSLMGLTVTAPPLAAAGGYYYATEYEPDWIEITQIELTLPRLAPQFNGFRLVQFSDIHRDEWMTPTRVADVINQVNLQLPDAIVLTGDLVTGLIRDVASDMTQALSELIAPTYSVPGNWDHWGYIPRWEQLMEESGIVNLMNRHSSIEREGQVLHIAGLDDALQGTPQLDMVASQIPSEGAAILLMHEPDFADITIKNGRFDLQLSGHSHGGQVNIPLLGPQYLPEMGQKYVRGLYQAGSFQLYVNRGVGMVREVARFNCRPEITVFTLRSPNI